MSLGAPFTGDLAIENNEVQHGESNDRVPPVNRLPHELLSDIFLLLHRTSHLRRSTSSVCYLWRLVINQTPLIWSKIVVFSRRDLGVSGAVERLNTLIDRSGMLLLDVFWDSFRIPEAAVSLAVATCLLERVPASRWRSLRLGRTGAIPIERISGTFENLRDLIIVEYQGGEEFLDVVAASAPKLAYLETPMAGVNELKRADFVKDLVGPETLLRTAVDCSDFHVMHAVRRLHVFSTSNFGLLPLLRELTIDYFTTSEIDLRRRCPNIETLTIRQFIYCRRPPKIILPQLRTFIFYGPNYALLGLVEAPKLHTLHIVREDRIERGPSQALTNALDNPMYQLAPSTLHIDCGCDITSIIQLIQLSPGLTNLTVGIDSQKDQWKSIFVALGRCRRAYSEGMEILGWQLCEQLATLHILLYWDQLDVEEARDLANELMVNRPIMQRVSVEWIDGYSIVVHG